MVEQSSSNKFENDDLNHHNEDIDYKNLIMRLQDISKTIVLLKKMIFKEI